MVSPPLNPAYATDVHNKLVISVKWCKIETLLLPTTNRNWYNSISNRAISDDNEWPSKLFAYWMRSQMRFLLRQRERLRSIVMNTSVFVCVCLSVCSRGYFRACGYTRDLYHFCARSLWPWLGPPASLRYVMYFRFCGWHHVSFL